MTYILPVIEIAAKEAINNFMKMDGDFEPKILFISQYIESLTKELELLKQKQEQIKIKNN